MISDLRLPDQSGAELIKKAYGVPVLIMTSYASLSSAVDVMKRGAVDYIAKPFDNNEFLERVHSILEKKKEQKLLKQGQLNNNLGMEAGTKGLGNIIGESESMQEVFRYVGKVAPTDATVLVLGESGTGKELVAVAIHAQSKRASFPMISVNCASIPETLMESELFGHEKGAFTGAATERKGLIEAAHQGTLFLDEIGELSMEAQARMLRVLQEGEIRRVGSTKTKKVNVRLIAATHRDLEQLVQDGRFRQDLYYRLKVVELNMPSLTVRGDDIMMLANVFLNEYCTKFDKKRMRFSQESQDLIKRYSWPGNVRELKHAIERAVILSDGDVIFPKGLNITVSHVSESKAISDIDTEKYRTLEEYFYSFVLENQNEMTETELAQKLGISRKTLWERRQKLGIPRKKSTV